MIQGSTPTSSGGAAWRGLLLVHHPPGGSDEPGRRSGPAAAGGASAGRSRHGTGRREIPARSFHSIGGHGRCGGRFGHPFAGSLFGTRRARFGQGPALCPAAGGTVRHQPQRAIGKRRMAENARQSGDRGSRPRRPDYGRGPRPLHHHLWPLPAHPVDCSGVNDPAAAALCRGGAVAGRRESSRR